MEYYRISGGRRLYGEVTVSGSKNAALPILFATLLVHGQSMICNLPDIRDVRVALSLLTECGAAVSYKNHVAIIDTAHCHASDCKAAADLRAGIYLLPVSLARFGVANIPLPGGCNFGVRPIDYHVKALTAMGATLGEHENGICGKANGFSGRYIQLPRPSVGATASTLLAAVTAKGRTVIDGAATEPHIAELCRFLRASGACIEGDGTPLLTINGVKSLTGTKHVLIADMVEAGTYLFMGAATGGEITVSGVPAYELTPVIKTLARMGASVSVNDTSVILKSDGRLSATNVTTAPFPGFPTDLQPLVTAALGLANGTSHIRETVWRNRFGYLPALCAMGANVHIEKDTATANGVCRYRGARVAATDLRGGAALVLAALTADGESRIENAKLIGRGYEALSEKIRILGGDIAYCEASNRT